MTRKGYIKLIMGYGYTRNLAQARAAIDLSIHGSYARAFKVLEPYFADRDIIDALTSTGDSREVAHE